jgi:hypothetical protein
LYEKNITKAATTATVSWYKVEIQEAIDFIGDKCGWQSSTLTAYSKLFDTAGQPPKLFTEDEIKAKTLSFVVPPEPGAPWTKEEIHNAVHALSLATIKYGMLNQNSAAVILALFISS